MKHDFIALERAVWATTARDIGKPPPVAETDWCSDYVRAIERAIVADVFGPLLALLDRGEPVHPMLLPALADAVRACRRNKASGRKPKLTTSEALTVAQRVLYLRNKGLTAANAVTEVAREFHQTEPTVKRAFDESIPVYRRPRKGSDS